MIAGREKALAASLAAVLFALLSLASGFDQYSAHLPSAVRLVPEWFRVDAGRSLAASALAQGDYAAAAAHARSVIRRDPLEPRAPAFLASAQQLSGRPEQARRSFRVAAALGWRAPITQAYWFAEALERGDTAQAALRLDALLRAHPGFPPAQEYLGLLEGTPAGRRALVERLRGNTRWAKAYLGSFRSPDDVLRARARFVAREAARGLAFGCERTLPMVRELARRNLRGDAEALLAGQCPEKLEAGLLADAGFERFGEDSATGFGWRRHGSGDTRITPTGGSDKAVELANRSGVTRLMLTQPVALNPGAYVARPEIPGAGAERLLLSLDCGAPARPSQSTGTVANGGARLVASACPDQVFGLWLRPGDGAVTVRSLSLLRE